MSHSWCMFTVSEWPPFHVTIVWPSHFATSYHLYVMVVKAFGIRHFTFSAHQNVIFWKGETWQTFMTFKGPCSILNRTGLFEQNNMGCALLWLYGIYVGALNMAGIIVPATHYTVAHNTRGSSNYWTCITIYYSRHIWNSHAIKATM